MATGCTVCHMDEQDLDGEWLTIGQLSQSIGITERNLRAYQARGLLPPPLVRARTGYYGPEHRARLELVKDLQAEGVKLDTIKRLFATTDGSTEQVLTFIRSLRALFGEQERTIVSAAELAERFSSDDTALLKKAERTGLLRQVGDDQYEEVLPQLTNIGASLVELGIPLDKSLDAATKLRQQADGIAKLFVELFLDEVWKPFDASGRPDEGWPALHETVKNLSTISTDALLAVVAHTIRERLDITFGRDLARTVRTAKDANAGRP